MPEMTNMHALLTKRVYQVVDVMIDHIAHLPHGYHWWYGLLPRTGRHNVGVVRKHWADTILTSLFPSSFLAMLVSASVLPHGKPNDPLYSWVLSHIYAGDIKALYTDWLAITKGQH